MNVLQLWVGDHDPEGQYADCVAHMKQFCFDYDIPYEFRFIPYHEVEGEHPETIIKDTFILNNAMKPEYKQTCFVDCDLVLEPEFFSLPFVDNMPYCGYFQNVPDSHLLYVNGASHYFKMLKVAQDMREPDQSKYQYAFMSHVMRAFFGPLRKIPADVYEHLMLCYNNP